jgi:hypothetical protein
MEFYKMSFQSFPLKISSLFLILATFVSCAHVNSVSLTPIPANRSKVVKAEVSKLIILAFNFDNDYIDPLVADLQSQCPNGVISGLLTKDETISYFLAFKKHVIATGYCNMATTKPTASTQR